MSIHRDATLARWRRVVDAQEASGIPISEFCRRRSIPSSSFFAWRKRLRSGETHPPAGAFVQVVQARRGPDAQATADDHHPPGYVPADPSRIEVHLADGVRLSLGHQFDPRALRRLLRVLQRDGDRCIGRRGGGVDGEGRP